MIDDCLKLAESLKQHARERVMAFWLEGGIDEQVGGYWTDLARNGSRYGNGEKWLIVQARTIYSMCLAYQFFDEPEFLAQAKQGVVFFRNHFRDTANGGWYYCVSRDGTEVLDDSKQPYGLAFATYALAEYARLSGDDDALRDAIESHELTIEKCWDKKHGGLPNKFTRNWELSEAIKRVDTHMHTMEGVSALYHATNDARYLARLNLLANTILGDIGVDGCYDPDHGCTHEMFTMDWQEALDRTRGLCNYGHVTEAGWFIAKLAAYTGDARHAQTAKSLVDWAVRCGFDQQRGGLFNYGHPTGQIADDRKVWWNQAELLGALAFLYRLTREQTYFDLLVRHVAFIDEYQSDRAYGEWYPTVNADGSVVSGEHGRQDNKGSRWKSPYHVIQGLYHAYRDLRRAVGVEQPQQPKQWADYCL